ncbi:hypothetical protein HBB16_03965 [Pseudonocardia sp. MCCB 268]|nr:hypothetical protein [Pseudonocardia cytotoxica]
MISAGAAMLPPRATCPRSGQDQPVARPAPRGAAAGVDKPGHPAGRTLLAGHASERFGRRPVFLATGVVNLVALPLLALGMGGLGPQRHRGAARIRLVITVTNAPLAAVPIFLNRLFPTRLRIPRRALIWNGRFALGRLA